MVQSNKKKVCPGCSMPIYGGNQGLVGHMKQSECICNKYIMICIECRKEFANDTHLQNNKKSQQCKDPYRSCIQGMDKLYHVQILSVF